MASIFEGLALDVERPTRVHLRHPVTGAPILHVETGEPAYIEVLGHESKLARKLRDDRDRERAKKGIATDAQTDEDIRAWLADTCARLCTGWSLCRLDGTPLDIAFTPELALALFRDDGMRPYVDQVVAASFDRSHFLPRGGTNSSQPPVTSSGSRKGKRTEAPVAHT